MEDQRTGRRSNWIRIRPKIYGSTSRSSAISTQLLVLFFALNVRTGLSGWTNRLAAVSTGVTLALYGILQAVDGVTLKWAVDAWANAPDAEKAARFAAADAIRWMEEGVRSYYDNMLGLAFVLFGVAIASSARVPRPIGDIMRLCGLVYIIRGWVLGAEGFSATHGLTQLPAYLLLLAWVVWLVAGSWRMKNPPPLSAAQDGS
jgi:hypothetical protein